MLCLNIGTHRPSRTDRLIYQAQENHGFSIFTARRYASAVYAVVMSRVSVCVRVCVCLVWNQTAKAAKRTYDHANNAL